MEAVMASELAQLEPRTTDATLPETGPEQEDVDFEFNGNGHGSSSANFTAILRFYHR